MRGGISFVALLVVNPVIILFYQNCSVLPPEMAVAQQKKPTLSERAPASVGPVKVESVGVCSQKGASCLERIQ